MSATNGYKPYYDAVIVGGRCAGASTAMLLARGGAKVLLIDRQGYGTDRISTHALMRGGVLQLHRWGLLPRILGAGTPEIHRTTFHYGDETIPVDIKADRGFDHLCAPRRTVLDRILVDAAREAGADVRHGVSLTGLTTAPNGRVTGVELFDGREVSVGAGIVIGADGRQSSVARLVSAQKYVESENRAAFVYGYFTSLPQKGFHWHHQVGTAAGVIPTNDGASCVFVGVKPENFAGVFQPDMEKGFLQAAGANSGPLRTDLEGARRVSRLFAFAGMPGYFRMSFGDGWALVGDAGYFKDPMTAHGITDALRDAESLANAVLSDDPKALRDYQAKRDALSMPLFEVTDAIASLDLDMDALKAMHMRLNKVMKAEVEAMDPIVDAAA